MKDAAPAAKPASDVVKLNLAMTKEDAIRKRMNLFYQQCPDHLVKEKKVLYKLDKSYQNYSLYNNLLRMVTFFQNNRLLLATKKRSLLRKYLFCLKMFAIIK